jgi:hypothetical protein
MRGFFRREVSIPARIQKQAVYYLVDYDFREHKENRFDARREMLKTLKIKTLSERTSTTSVIPVETIEEALKLCKILLKYGAAVNLRECRAVTQPDGDAGEA